MHIQAPNLFQVAKEAYARMSGTPSDRSPWGIDALVVILFAATALEALINEVADLACTASLEDPPSVKAFGDLMKEIDKSRVSIEGKYLLAKWVLSGQAYDKGAQPYQDFTMLIKLRNAVAHVKAFEDVRFEEETGISIQLPKPVRNLEAKNILAVHDVPEDLKHVPMSVSWIGLVCTRAVGRWACNAASAIALSLVEAVPDCSFKCKLGWVVSNFQPVQ